jgi:hypothetical protein
MGVGWDFTAIFEVYIRKREWHVVYTGEPSPNRNRGREKGSVVSYTSR